MKNTTEAFQRAMDVFLASDRRQFALLYVEDLIVFSNSPADHIEHVWRVLRLLYEAGVTIGLKKCRTFLRILSTLVMLFDLAAWNVQSI